MATWRRGGALEESQRWLHTRHIIGLGKCVDDFGEMASTFCYDAPVQHHILLLVDGKYTTHVSVSLTLGLRYLVLVSCGAGLCPRVLARFLMLGFERGKAHTPGYAGQAVTF